MYFPHNVDFRGRAYPIPPYFNHIGADLCRSLLKFKEGKPFGADGLKWFKVHMANLAGFDKAPFAEREKFIDDRMNDVLDSADKPFDGAGWWLKADDPWQLLACCIELAEAVRSSDPEAFVSHIPVHMDGSCNGLQHYAALGRDIDGARQVNLMPGPKPGDVYSAVAHLVSEKIERDAQNNHPVGLKLRGKVNRKVVKLPVMTNVYGVTQYGVREQISDTFKELNSVQKEDLSECSSYVAKYVFEGLDALFDSARKIQTWFSLCAEEISRSVPRPVAERFLSNFTLVKKSPRGKEEFWNPSLGEEFEGSFYPQTPVSWTTPLGFPVCQPYRKDDNITLRTAMQTVRIRREGRSSPVLVSKQVAGFPPNYIHSLDASHMILTALACFKAGLTFSSVHDCFWTHARDIPTMNRILREEFVRLHSMDVLQNLRKEFIEKYGNHVVPIVQREEGKKRGEKVWRSINIPPLPKFGDLDINSVKESEYFFS